MTPVDEPGFHYVIEHSDLGHINGIQRSQHTIQYLGVQYASLNDRFARAQLVTSKTTMSANGVIDATKYGYAPNLSSSNIDFSRFQTSSSEAS
jgi:hypothetical protein